MRNVLKRTKNHLSYWSPKSNHKKKIFQKWPNSQGRCGLIWQRFFSSWFFFVRLSFWDKSILLMALFTIFKCFYRTKKVKNNVHLKRCAMFWSEFLYLWVFFVRFLVSELWSILYSTVRWDLAKNLEVFVVKYAVGANHWG